MSGSAIAAQRFERLLLGQAIAALLLGCGTGSATLRGTIVDAGAATALASFGDQEPGAAPVAGATVRFEAASHAKNCNNLTPLEPRNIKRPNVVTTQQDGAYSVWVAFPAKLAGKTLLVLCVAHPDYAALQYTLVYEVNLDRTQGKVPLTIRLKRRAM